MPDVEQRGPDFLAVNHIMRAVIAQYCASLQIGEI